MPPPPGQPTAQGSFEKTPLPHLLVYALERHLTGGFWLLDPAGTELASFGVASGRPALEEDELGQLFSLPRTTSYLYFDGRAPEPRGAPIDPLPALWRGIKQTPSWEHIDATLKRVGGAALRLTPGAGVRSFSLARAELAAVEALAHPTRLVDLVSSKVVGPSLAQQLVYFLVITKQLEIVAGAPAPAPPTSSRAPTPLTPSRAPSPPPAPPATPLGRVQIASSPRPAPRIVEENAASGHDDRVSTSSMYPNALAAVVAALPPPLQARGAAILARAAAISSENYFQMLGLPANGDANANASATSERAQASFVALAKEWHPDRLPPALAGMKEIKDACARVFAHLSEAHATLVDDTKRREYAVLVREGGATPDDRARIQTILEASMAFQKAEILMKTSATDPRVIELVRRAVSLDPEQVEYMALLTWVEAQQPAWQAKDKTLEKVAVLDRCLEKNPKCERAYFYRAMLKKRAGEAEAATQDFRAAAELNPRNLDAVREVRLHTMRVERASGRPSPVPSPAQGGSAPGRAGLLGKLFKKS